MNDVQVTDAEFWHVQLPSGEVAYWSLDELDEAFNRDAVDANTFVLKVGEASWQRLGELLGLDDAAAPVVVAAPVAPVSIAPSSLGGNDLYGAQSIRPVVADLSDLDDDDLAAAMKPKRKNLAAIAGGAVVALGLVIAGITHAASGSDAGVAAAAAPPPVANVVAAPDPAADPVAPQATLSDDMKRQLLAADKAREAKAAARAAETAKYHTHVRSYRAPKSGNVFHKGGNKYDPLNSAE